MRRSLIIHENEFMSSFNVKEVAFQNHYGVEERTFEADGLGMVGTHKQINFMGFSVQSTMMSLPYRLGIHNVNAQD
ncbi:MAG TPA: hypothetical protein VL947_00335, partial [Cytophagales bacterium]|nr:hypothetical protein [Cytophagales bacterium]